MAKEQYYDDESRQLTGADNQDQVARNSVDSVSSISTTSIVLERLNRQPHDTITSNDSANRKLLGEEHHSRDFEKDVDLEDSVYDQLRSKPFDKKARCLIWLIGSVLVGAWILTLIILLLHQTYKHSSSIPHDPAATATRGSGKKVTMDQIFSGQWRPNTHDISWIPGADGEDGLLLERLPGRGDKDYLIVEDVRRSNASAQVTASKTLMKGEGFQYGSNWVFPSNVWPSRDQKSVLLSSEQQKNWRHSSTAKYWIFDVATQTGQPLDPDSPDSRIQLATWSPTSDHIAFTRDNNLFVRSLSSSTVTQITTDGGIELFYGVPDWVYEEEVFSSNVATWWSGDGKFIAFLRTNESTVPEYPIEYFVSRPSGDTPPPGEENYPETREIKYPKAGAPNPLVDLQFYDIEAGKTFSVDISEDFPGNDRLITEVVWAGASGKVLIRETNRESDILQVVVIDTTTRSGTVVRKVDVNTLDGGWFEVSQSTRYIPADAAKNRPQDGYIDTVIHDGYDHLAYFTPIESSEPIILTSGNWEVVDAPSAIDLKNNLVYFVGTKEGPTQRHVYSVRLDGSSLKAVTDISEEGYYSASFSSGAGYALLSYAGPKIPWQKVMSTPGNDDYFEDIIEDNKHLASFASQHELPLLVYQNVTVDGYTLQVVERRPPHFNPKRKYPVLFYLYGGPGSQMVDKKFNVDFQAYIASGLGYIVVTVDGRGTGFIGRKARCIIRGNLGYYESKDQIATAKIWAEKDYVDESRLAIWGWSYGGFMTLKTLEQDAGNTFHYGMAVAPVTDWRFYDSIYTERYMHTPQHNADGYNNASISDVTALQNNVRFLVMHGVADDNVHLQNTLTLLDKLDLAGIENYDVHFFPDSDHNIYFHNANRMVYDRLNDWLINAFNGEWLKTVHPSPSTTVDVPSKSR